MKNKRVQAGRQYTKRDFFLILMMDELSEERNEPRTRRMGSEEFEFSMLSDSLADGNRQKRDGDVTDRRSIFYCTVRQAALI